jgi:BRCT domain type II-containing protein
VSDQSTENISCETRETRANSAPDLQCSSEANSDQAGPGVWFVDTKTNSSPVSSATTSAPVVPAAIYNATTVSSATKARTKSYATTQDGSRLSYCEVATGLDSVTFKNEDDVQVRTLITESFPRHH